MENQTVMEFKPGDLVSRRETMTRTDSPSLPQDARGIVISVDAPQSEAGRLVRRPVLVAWNDTGASRRHFAFELELIKQLKIEQIVLNVMLKLTERCERTS